MHACTQAPTGRISCQDSEKHRGTSGELRGGPIPRLFRLLSQTCWSSGSMKVTAADVLGSLSPNHSTRHGETLDTHQTYQHPLAECIEAHTCHNGTVPHGSCVARSIVTEYTTTHAPCIVQSNTDMYICPESTGPPLHRAAVPARHGAEPPPLRAGS